MDWKLINSFAPWFSAIGTIFAAIIALRLSRRDNHRTIVIDTDCGPKYPRKGVAESICIRVSNVARRPIPITGVFWEGKNLNIPDIPILPNTIEAHKELSTILPAKLLEGDFCEIHLCTKDFANSLFYDAERINIIECILLIKYLKVKVECGTGYYFSKPISKTLKRHIYKRYFAHHYNRKKWIQLLL